MSYLGFAIGADYQKDKLVNEVNYYTQQSFNAYSFQMKRMDSHGGWIATASDLLKLLVHVDGFSTKRYSFLNPLVLIADTVWAGKSMAPDFFSEMDRTLWKIILEQKEWPEADLFETLP